MTVASGIKVVVNGRAYDVATPGTDNFDSAMIIIANLIATGALQAVQIPSNGDPDFDAALASLIKMMSTGAPLTLLSSNPTAPVAPVGSIAFRSNAGVLEVSQSGGAYGPVAPSFPGPGLNVAQFGAKGDGDTDDSTALQAAFAAALSLNRPLDFGAGLTYLHNSELVINGIRINGNRATLKAGTAMRSQIVSHSQLSNIFDLLYDAQDLAKYHVLQAFQTRHFRCQFANAVIDAIRLADSVDAYSVNNDKTVVSECDVTEAGHAFVSSGFGGVPSGVKHITVPGTVSMSGNTITGSSTTWFTDADPNKRLTNWRKGDLIFIGSSPGLQIESVDGDGQITTQSFVTGSYSGQYKVCIGDGYHEDSFSDNNINTIDDCRFNTCAGSGAVVCGLYGTKIPKLQSDFNGGYALVVGQAGGAAPSGTVVDQLYCEGNGVLTSDVLMAHANGAIIHSLISANNDFDTYGLANGYIGTTLNDSGFLLIKPIGFPVSKVANAYLYLPPADPGSVPFKNMGTWYLDDAGSHLKCRVLMSDGVTYKTFTGTLT